MADAALQVVKSDGGRPGQRVIRLTGPLTITTFFPLRDALRQETFRSLILDMTGVNFVDSAGLGAIVAGFISCQRDGRKFVLVGGNDRVKALLQMSHLDAVLKTFPSQADAEAWLSG